MHFLSFAFSIFSNYWSSMTQQSTKLQCLDRMIPIFHWNAGKYAYMQLEIYFWFFLRVVQLKSPFFEFYFSQVEALNLLTSKQSVCFYIHSFMALTLRLFFLFSLHVEVNQRCRCHTEVDITLKPACRDHVPFQQN